jgi:hypothetical protein
MAKKSREPEVVASKRLSLLNHAATLKAQLKAPDLPRLDLALCVITGVT